MRDKEKVRARHYRYDHSEKGLARRKRDNSSVKAQRRKYKYKCAHTPITAEKILKVILSNYGRN